MLCMLIGYSGHVFTMCFCHVVSLQYPPLNEVSCVYWYRVGCYSPQTPQVIVLVLGITSYRIAELGTELRSKQEDYDKEIHRSRNELGKKEKE